MVEGYLRATSKGSYLESLLLSVLARCPGSEHYDTSAPVLSDEQRAWLLAEVLRTSVVHLGASQSSGRQLYECADASMRAAIRLA